jgi:hypothetical protein
LDARHANEARSREYAQRLQHLLAHHNFHRVYQSEVQTGGQGKAGRRVRLEGTNAGTHQREHFIRPGWRLIRHDAAIRTENQTEWRHAVTLCPVLAE